MTAEKKEQGVSRRGFLRGAGLGAGAAGVAAVSLTAVASTGTASEADPKRRAAGYRETEHVRRAYELARF